MIETIDLGLDEKHTNILSSHNIILYILDTSQGPFNKLVFVVNFFCSVTFLVLQTRFKQ